jgi:hypothetical protein
MARTREPFDPSSELGHRYFSAGELQYPVKEEEDLQWKDKDERILRNSGAKGVSQPGVGA